MNELRRLELLSAAVSAVRMAVASGDDPAGYFDEFKAMQVDNCADRDRPLWESITLADVEAEAPDVRS